MALGLAELLGEITDEEVETQKEYNVELEKTAELSKEAGLEEDMQAPYYMSELADAAEEAYDQGGLSVDEVVDFVQQHLGGKYGR